MGGKLESTVTTDGALSLVESDGAGDEDDEDDDDADGDEDEDDDDEEPLLTESRALLLGEDGVAPLPPVCDDDCCCCCC